MATNTKETWTKRNNRDSKRLKNRQRKARSRARTAGRAAAKGELILL